MSRRLLVLALVTCLQVALVGLAVAPRLSARVAGEEHLLRVAPLDPIDPFRGAYVQLAYPDLVERGEDGMWHHETDGDERGDLYLPLRQQGEVWVAGEPLRDRPSSGPYLACTDRDWDVRCGIESYFLPQEDALAMEKAVAGSHALARVSVDRWGNAALVEIVVPE